MQWESGRTRRTLLQVVREKQQADLFKRSFDRFVHEYFCNHQLVRLAHASVKVSHQATLCPQIGLEKAKLDALRN
jgi:hypothetical protein